MKKEGLSAAQIAAYAQALREEERAPATVEKYLRDVRAFAAFVGGGAVTRERAAGWREHLLSGGLTPATVNAKLSALNGLFRFLGWEECRVKFLRVQRRVFRDRERELTREEYRRLVEAAQSGGRERLELLMEAICSTGIRVSEVRYLTVEAARSGRAEVRLKGKIRSILLPRKLCRKLLKFAGKQKTASGAIFRAGDGRPLSRHRIWREMKALCGRAGVAETKVFPHNLRHPFAALFYRATRDIVKLADVLGHSSVETTRIYLMSNGQEHVRQLDRLGLVS